jgi:hypothetical protein
MPQSKIQRWCRAVEGASDSYEGKLALSSLVHDLDEKHISRRVLSQLLRKIRALFATWHKRGTAALYVITEVADAEPQEFFCRGMLGPSRDANCSRLMLDREFFHQNVNLSANGHAITGAAISDAHIKSLVDNPQAYISKHFPPLTMKRPFVWVTETGALEEVVREEERKKRPPADRVRNKLGLAHFLPAGEPRLLEIRYPPSFFRKRKRVPFAAPTFLEGRPPNMVYRSMRNSQGWGITVDLDNGEAGLPEAVHGRIRLKGDFKVRNLGRFVAVTAGYSFEKMFRDAPTKWDPARTSELEDLANG